MAVEPERTVSLSGLTEHEAKAFHGVFITGFLGFTFIAIVAHILMWMWKPWFLALPDQTSSLSEGLTTVATLASPLIG
ncbi:MAG: light-harvesting antenna LH1, beta subunit [Pseudomonadota bacterium]